MRILIADDHALFRDGLRSLLQSQGHEIVGEARNGKQAVDMAIALHPDIVDARARRHHGHAGADRSPS